VTQFGGHCGFLDRLTGPTWVERRILAELDAEPQPAALDPVLTGA
jgi:predicted alpha/beta-fold hydrolase